MTDSWSFQSRLDSELEWLLFSNKRELYILFFNIQIFNFLFQYFPLWHPQLHQIHETHIHDDDNPVLNTCNLESSHVDNLAAHEYLSCHAHCDPECEDAQHYWQDQSDRVPEWNSKHSYVADDDTLRKYAHPRRNHVEHVSMGIDGLLHRDEGECGQKEAIDHWEHKPKWYSSQIE